MDDRRRYEAHPPRRPRPRPPMEGRQQPRRRRRPAPPPRRQGTPVLALIFFILIVGLVLYFFTQWNRNQVGEVDVFVQFPTGEDNGNDSATPPQDTEPTLDDDPIPYVSNMMLVPVASLNDNWYLKLVNRQHALSGEPPHHLMVDAFPTVPVRATYIQVHQTLLNAVSNLFAEAPSGLANLFITSGYRGVARQTEIYNNAVNRLYVMTPGHSEHHLGLAADILGYGIPMASMSGTPEAIWLAENAIRHGLILRYPYGSTPITEVAYEPWHFRYVGRIHAWYMYQNNMLLEEYLPYLASTGGFTATLDGRTYHVFYHTPVNDHVEVPRHMEFIVSQSNLGGYVITAWE